MYSVIQYLIIIAVAYLVGSFPSGYILTRLWGHDIRQHGSGRTGGTNVMRTVGAVPALLTVVLDTLKGLIAVGLAGALIGTPAAQALAGLAAIIGHDYSIFLQGGGRGVATSFAVLAALALYPAAVVWVVFLGVLLLSRYASLASVTIAILMPVAMLVWIMISHDSPWYLVYGFGAGALIIYLHRDNIQRLWLGTERKVGEKATVRRATV